MLWEKTDVIKVQILPSSIPLQLTKKCFIIKSGYKKPTSIHIIKIAMLIFMIVKTTTGLDFSGGSIIKIEFKEIRIKWNDPVFQDKFPQL